MSIGSIDGAEKIRFSELPLEPEAPGIASHAREVNGVRWALVKYEPGVLREEWCEEGHSGYVIEGEITYEVNGGESELKLEAGDAFTLAEDSKHRGKAGPEGVVLFIIDRPA